MHEKAIEVFKCLADPTRLRMVARLSTKKEMGCSNLSPHFSYLSQPTLSHHYNKLVQAGIVSMRKEGTSVFYCLNKDLLKEVGISIKDLRKYL